MDMKENTHAIKVEVFAADGTIVCTFEVPAAQQDVYPPGYETPAPRVIIDLLKRSSLG